MNGIDNREQPLLSICIPTYNRANLLDRSLTILRKQLASVEVKIEVIISDNCSTDHTPTIIQKHLNQGLNAEYLRNESNIGASRNFIKCFTKSLGKYCWILGDDDLLADNALNTVVNTLQKGTFGLLHMQMNKTKNKSAYTIYNDTEKFLSNVSYWITFISANIVNLEHLEKLDLEKYIETRLLQVPLYAFGALNSTQNIQLHTKIFQDENDSNNNGGYNFFEIFITKYLGIWKEFRDSKQISSTFYRREKYNLFRHFLVSYIEKLLFRQEVGRFGTENAWKILREEYKWDPYFYFGITYAYIRSLFGKRKT